MQIKIFEGTKEDWNKFLIENDGSFLQSFEWGEFQKSLQKKIWRFLIKEKGKTIGEVQIIKETFPFGKSLFYIPFGPCFSQALFSKGKKEVLNLILKEVKKIAKKEKAIFLKIEPLLPLPKLQEANNSQKRFQPQKTLLLNLKNKTEEEMFEQFHQKTRYNIRLAERKGVEVVKFQIPNSKSQTPNPKFQNNSYDYFDAFYKLIQKTAKRDKFTPYPKSYYQKLIEKTGAYLFLAKYKEKIIAANIVIFFGKEAIYLHGASNYKYRKVMAPHLLQWVQIKEAKKRGCEIYDFWGINEKKWPGITRFKKGFGGEEFQYPESKDFIFSKFWYKAYQALRKFFRKNT